MDQSTLSEISSFLFSSGCHLNVTAADINVGWVSVIDGGFKGGFLVESCGKTGGYKVVVNDWRVGKAKFKRIGGRALSAEEKADLKLRRKELEEETKEEHRRVQAFVYRKLDEWRSQLPPAALEKCTYLARKNLPQYVPSVLKAGLNTNEASLIVPMEDKMGVIWNVQEIFDKGKYFWPGGMTKGLFHVIRGANGQSSVLLGEGYATCLAAREATGLTSYCAFSCGNLEAVLRVMLGRYQAGQIVLLVDWDVPLQTGLGECVRLVEKYGVRLSMPYPRGSVEQDVSVDCADVWVFDPDHLKMALSESFGVGEVDMFKDFIPIEEIAPSGKDEDDLSPAETSDGGSGDSSRKVGQANPPKNCGSNGGNSVKADAIEEIVGIPDGGGAQNPEVLVVERVGEPWTPPKHEIGTRGSGFHDTHPVGDQGGVRKIPNYSDLRLAFDEAYHYVTHTEGKNVYAFDGRKFELVPELAIKGFAEDNFKPAPDLKKCAEFMGSVLRHRRRSTAFFNVENKINFRNGWAELDQEREVIVFRPHTPEIGFKSCLDYDFDEHATCPTFDRFLEKVFGHDRDLERMVVEYLGYVLSGDECWAEKALVLKGEGSNGKSTFLKTVRRLVGDGNYTSSKLGELKNQYSRQRLDGKLLNIAEETPKDALLDSSIFKDIVSGGEIEVRAIYGSPYDLTVRAKIIFSCNDLPVATDHSHAFARRLLIAPFNVTFSEDDADFDPHFAKKLQLEIPGIFNRCIRGYFDLAKRQRFVKAKATDAALRSYQLASNPVASWVEACVRVESADDERISSTDEMYFEFTQWAEARGHKRVTLDWFGRTLARSVPLGLKRRDRVRHQKHQFRGFYGLLKLDGTPWLPE